MELQVFSRMVYGQLKLYPANDAARTLAQLIGKQTFTATDLRLAEKLGHTFTMVRDPQVIIPGVSL